MTELDGLIQIITNGVAAIQAGIAERDASFPSLRGSLDPESEAARDAFAAEIFVVTAAAHQLIATLASPTMYPISICLGIHSSRAIAVAEACHVAEILREAGPNGMHVKDISAKNGVDHTKLSRILRLLASQHVFTEVAPDVFANNRHSSSLDTRKSLDALSRSPAEKWDNAPGIAAPIGHFGDEVTKSSAYLVEHLTHPDPVIALSQEPTGGTFQFAFKTEESLFQWYERPENITRLKRFGNTMKSHSTRMSPAMITQGFDWASLPPNSIVVDVGGGIGASTLMLAGTHKHLRYIVQDRDSVIGEARKAITEKPQDGSDLVQFQAHDFFQEQTVKDPSIFILRLVLHDWSDKYCSVILNQLRKSATASTKLIVIDAIIDYACPTEDIFGDIPGALAPPGPAPLLPNFGGANLFQYWQDLQMMSLLNSRERTIGQFKGLLEQTGWKLEKVHRLPPPNLPQLVASPL